MLSKAKIKLVQSLKDKKHRMANGLFIVEGTKNVAELLRSKIKVKTLFTTMDWLTHEQENIQSETEVITIEKEDFSKLSSFQSLQEALALAIIPEGTPTIPKLGTEVVLALDTIQDPGNFGTIMRIADWYGISHIYCSPGCADLYNPKVIQATMGSFTRVTVQEVDLVELFTSNPDTSVYGALMEGESIHQKSISHGILLIGNEGSGIHPNLMSYITDPITIPRFGGAESLNAAVATAIICDNIRRLHP